MNSNIFNSAAGKLSLPQYKEYVGGYLSGKDITEPPITLEIHPSAKCQQNCPRCPSLINMERDQAKELARGGQFLDMRLLDQILAHPPKGIIYSGHTGEPLVNPEVDAIIHAVHAKGIPALLITNGENLDQPINRQIARECTAVRISIDAGSEEVFRITHGVKNRFQKVMDNIASLVEARNSQGILPENCYIGVGFLLDQVTAKDAVKATALARQMGVDYIQLRPFHFQQFNAEGLIKECLTYETPNFKVLPSSQKGILIGKKFTRNYQECHGAHFVFNVLSAAGELYICCHTTESAEASLGRLNPDDPQSREKWLVSDRRHRVTRGFEVANCLPDCRLNVQNTVLQELLNQGAMEVPPEAGDNLSALAKKHADFM
jgi:pyruvate-formate lyase-activating enzyme